MSGPENFPPRAERHSSIVQIAFVALAILLFSAIYYPLLSGRMIFTHDAIIWYGHFHYFTESLLHGQFPYWDPYIAGGSPFYPNLPATGLLDPVVWICVLLRKFFSISPLFLYVCFRLLRLLIFALGAFFLFNWITGSRTAATFGAVILFFAMPFGYFAQNGIVDIIYLTPFALYFLLGFFEASGNRKLLFAAAFSCVSGIMMNVHIPTYYLFNITFFILALLIVKRHYILATIQFLRSGHHALFMLLLVASAALMAAPPLMVAARDASAEGELFPLLRIVQSNNDFKVMPASDFSTGSLSRKYVASGRTVFSSKTDLVRFLYPEMGRIGHPDILEISDSRLYIGILPFLFAFVGIAWYQSGLKVPILVMLPLLFIVGFSFPLRYVPDSGLIQGFLNIFFPPYEVRSSELNLLQKFIDVIFPPLKMIDVRAIFSSFFLLYICMLMAMGLAVVVDPDRFQRFVMEKKYKVIALCGILVTIKAGIAYYLEGVPCISFYDFFLLLQLCGFGFIMFLASRKRIAMTVVTVIVAACILADLSVYNFLYREWSLQDGTQFSEALGRVEEQRMDAKEFEYFRNPYVFLPINYPLASQESIAKEKGAFTYGNNHMFFTTRRYYDLFTHASLENQFILFGMVYPLVRFYPSAQVVQVDDKHALLDYFSGQSDAGARLFLEDPNKSYRTSPFSGDFKQYPDAGWLAPKNVMNTYNRFVSENLEVLTQIRSNPAQFLSTPEGSVRVTDFSANEVVMEVENAVDGYLYYNDGWSRYWRAFDNGREIPVQIANYNFKAVFIAPGRHRVRFLFDPLPYRIGLAAYGAGFIALVGFILFFGKSSAKSDERVS